MGPWVNIIVRVLSQLGYFPKTTSQRQFGLVLQLEFLWE